MASFKDNKGRKWRLAIDAPTILEIRNTCHVDLAGLEGGGYERLADDPVLLVDALWLICREQAEDRGVSDVDFGRALVGDAIDHASEALVAAMLDFFPKPKRALLTAITARNQQMRKLALDQVLEKVSDPEMQQEIMRKMERYLDSALTPVGCVIDTPVSAESAPAA